MRTTQSMGTGRDFDLAFAIIVFTAYFSTFSSITKTDPVQMVGMILAGIAYISIGVYGYSYCVRSGSLTDSLVYFLVQIPLGGLIIYLSGGSGFNVLILLPLAGHSVILLPQNMVYLCNFFIMGAFLLAGNYLALGIEKIWADLPTFVAGQIFVLVFTQMAVGEERARREVERLVHELSEANQQLREYAVQVEELTLTRERNRMAREIHDGLGHYMTTIYMQLQAAQVILFRDPDKAKDAVATAQRLAQEALADVRKSVAALRSDPTEGKPLAERIASTLENVKAAGIESLFTLEGDPRELSPQAELTLFRAAQEGINNILKHSHARHIWIVLDFSVQAKVRLTVRDDGKGAENLSGGFGLIGLQERVKLLGGELTTQSRKGEGFTLNMVVPE